MLSSRVPCRITSHRRFRAATRSYKRRRVEALPQPTLHPFPMPLLRHHSAPHNWLVVTLYPTFMQASFYLACIKFGIVLRCKHYMQA